MSLIFLLTIRLKVTGVFTPVTIMIVSKEVSATDFFKQALKEKLAKVKSKK
jgi:hypothetical protein